MLGLKVSIPTVACLPTRRQATCRGKRNKLSRPFSGRPSSVKEAAASGQEVSNSSMRYVADPLSEDPGIAPPARDPPSAPPVAATNAKKKKAPVGTSLVTEIGDGEAEGGRVSILKTLRECVGKGGGGDGGGGKGKGVAAGNVNVSAWKGLGGDDHVAGKNCLKIIPNERIKFHDEPLNAQSREKPTTTTVTRGDMKTCLNACFLPTQCSLRAPRLAMLFTDHDF